MRNPSTHTSTHKKPILENRVVRVLCGMAACLAIGEITARLDSGESFKEGATSFINNLKSNKSGNTPLVEPNPSDSKGRIPNIKSLTEQQEQKKDAQGNPVNFFDSIFDGNGRLNLGSSILQAISASCLPMHARFSSNHPGEKSLKIYIPYEYARKFDVAAPLTNANASVASTFINKQIKDQLKPIIDGTWQSSKIAFLREGDLPKSQRSLTSMQVTGLASPEAVNEASLISSDNENEKLAFDRAQVGKTLAVRELDKSGIKVDPSKVDIKAEELSFSKDEWVDGFLII